MREIKFRAWDMKRNYMVSPGEYDDEFITFKGVPTEISAFDGYWYPEPLQYELMQYTGLKDKNGKEIYEGDVVNGQITTSYYRRGVVQFSEGSFRFREFYQDGLFTEFEESPNAIDFFYNLEVIGNQFENPELLEGEQ